MQPGLIFDEVSSCVPAVRHTGIHPYSSGPNPRLDSVSSGSIPGWDPAPGLVTRMFSTTASRYIKTNADQGLGVVRIKGKNDADLIVGIMALATRKANAIQAQTNPPPADTSIPRGS